MMAGKDAPWTFLRERLAGVSGTVYKLSNKDRVHLDSSNPCHKPSQAGKRNLIDKMDKNMVRAPVKNRDRNLKKIRIFNGNRDPMVQDDGSQIQQ